MGMMKNLADRLKLGDEYGDTEYEDEVYDEEDDYVEPQAPAHKEEPKSNKKMDKQVQPAPKRRIAMSDSSVCVFKPKSFDDAREIAETLLENKTVVMNFEGVDLSVSQRVLDVVTGVCIAIRGNLQQISNYIFMATPESVDVMGDFQDTLAGTFDTI